MLMKLCKFGITEEVTDWLKKTREGNATQILILLKIQNIAAQKARDNLEDTDEDD